MLGKCPAKTIISSEFYNHSEPYFQTNSQLHPLATKQHRVVHFVLSFPLCPLIFAATNLLLFHLLLTHYRNRKTENAVYFENTTRLCFYNFTLFNSDVSMFLFLSAGKQKRQNWNAMLGIKKKTLLLSSI